MPVFLLFVAILGATGVGGWRLVQKYRQQDIDQSLEAADASGEVVGLPGIPVYPGSTFMFEHDIEEDVVQKFLASGKSAYLLPYDIEWKYSAAEVTAAEEEGLDLKPDVVTYYTDELEKRGFQHVLSVDLADDDRLAGEYWVFEVFAVQEDGSMGASDPLQSYGLRIYAQNVSVWYQKISMSQARSGLADMVAQEESIQLLLAMGSVRELPNTFPWKLSYPEVWDADIRSSGLSEAPLVEFTSMTDQGSVVVEPVAYDKGQALTAVADTYMSSVNTKRSADSQLQVDLEETTKVAGVAALKRQLSSGADRGFIAVVVHPKNGIIYVISTFDEQEALFEYIVTNLAVR